MAEPTGKKKSLPRLTDRIAFRGSARAGAWPTLEVSPFCLGRVGKSRVVLEAFDAGINFFFVTADMHWPLYEEARRGLRQLFARGGGVRDRVVVAAVSYVAQAEFCHYPFREVIDAVPGLRRLDMTVIGGTYASDFFARLCEYQAHKAAGGRGVPGVRATGATFHARPAAVLAANHRLVDLAFIRYNTAHRGADEDVFPFLRSSRAPIYGFKATLGLLPQARYRELGVMPSRWRPGATDHYRFALAAGLDGLLCSFASPKHVAELADALARGPLTTAEVKYMRALADLDLGVSRAPPAHMGNGAPGLHLDENSRS